MGIEHRYHASPILHALCIPNLSLLTDINYMLLYKNIMGHVSAATHFYKIMSIYAYENENIG